MATIAGVLRAHAANDRVGIVFGEQSWSWAEVVCAAGERASLLASLELPLPGHVGILLENVPEFVFWLGGVALAGGTVAGINPTRRGAELARDITHADCRLIVTEARHLPLLEGLDLRLPPERVLVVDEPSYAVALAEHRGAPLPPDDPPPERPYLLLFTSGTTDAPKASICSQARLARAGSGIAAGLLSSDDVIYLVMPLFHSNALMAGLSPGLNAGCTIVLRRRFSASGFLPDVRRYGVTYFNYVGKPMAYILATPEQPDDADNPLRVAFGNEAAEGDIDRFAARFVCVVVDNYGSTEGGINILRMPGMPPGALGKPSVEGVVVLDPATGAEKPLARFDDHHRLLNSEESIGELCAPAGVAVFEGYYNNASADHSRVHDGIYWTGDLAYRDAEGWIYFAGRDFDWLRVDGENFAAAPVERILGRYPEVALAVVYGVPDVDAGDQVMAALQLRPGAGFDPWAFAAFLENQQDLGTKWAPRFVRVATELPMTETNKVRKRELRAQRWECADPVWWRPEKGAGYRLLATGDVGELRRRFEERGRANVLDAR